MMSVWRKFKIIFIFFIGLSMFGAVAYAAESVPTPVGKVVWIKGKLLASMPNKEERSLQKGSIIYLKDTLITDAGSQAQIVFTDNSLLTFKPSTKFSIDQYEYNPGSKKKSVGKYVMGLIEGGFRTITGLIAKKNPQDYQINTPVATIGVRGTDYAVAFKGGQLMMAYYHGSPCMSSKKETLCLSAAVPFGAVPSAGAAPIQLKTAPAIFDVKDPIVPVKIGSSFTGSGSSTTPSAAPRSAGGVFSSFCITQ